MPRSKASSTSIPGVGEKRRNDLLKAFRSVKAVKAASEAELADVVGKALAEKIYEYFHPSRIGPTKART